MLWKKVIFVFPCSKPFYVENNNVFDKLLPAVVCCTGQSQTIAQPFAEKLERKVAFMKRKHDSPDLLFRTH